MANVNAPFGFRHAGNVGGGAPTYQTMPGAEIAYNDTNALYTGDPVTLLTTGYITRATAGTTPVYGIFMGCEYLNPSTNQIQFSKYWPGVAIASTSAVKALVVNDPNAEFLVQATSTNLGRAAIGANVQFTYTAGSSLTGLSACTVDSPNVTTTLPFRVTRVLNSAPYIGYDATDSYNWVFVTFNNAYSRITTGI